MICTHCHTVNPDDSQECAACGAPLPVMDHQERMDGADASASSQAHPDSQLINTVAMVVTPPKGPAWKASASANSPGLSSGISTTLAPGSQLGARYRIESLLGRGGMGTVYKAYDKELDRTVALKLLRSELIDDPVEMQRFKQELLLASKISHKNILRIHDLGEVPGLKFISMAYVEGEDLHHRLESQGRLPLDRTVNIARQLCAALEAAHGEGVIHRDLKPQNVLLDGAGNAYVSDFGLARSIEAASAGMTRTGQVLGTPRYMSPEQVECKPLDQRSDLYSLGLIFYEMVTGDVPFKGDSALQLMYQRVKVKPKNPKLLNPELPDYLVRIILRCLERDPTKRYQYAREILADLDAQRSPSKSISVQIALPMPTRRTWLIAGGSVLLLLLLALGIPKTRHWVFRMEAPRPTTPADTAAPGQVKYLAVLPFRILGDKKQLGYVGEGLMEALSAKLYQLKDVRVASTQAIEKVNQDTPLARIAQELGVNLIVQGTLQGSKEKVRIVMGLDDVTGGRRLWTQEFSGVPQDLLTLEDQIYVKLAEALQLKPSNEELARVQMHPTENIAAYELYLQGRSAMRGQQLVKNVETAIRLYEDALKKDPTFALAYTGIADASLVMYQETKNSFWSQKALAAAEQAQGLNNSLAEVHFSLGNVYSTTGKLAEASVELRRALELAPNSDEGYRLLGAVYLAGGQKEEAIQAYRKAIEINSYYWVNYNWMGNTYFQLGEYDKALTAYRRMTEMDPENAFGYLNIGAVYIQQGKYEECVPWLQKALALQPYFMTYSNLGTAYFYLKRYSDAVAMFEKAVQMNPNDQMIVGNLADAYRWSGQKQKAMTTYDKAISLAYKQLEVNPRKALLMGFMALYYAKKGDVIQAANFIHRARAIDPNGVELIYDEATVEALAGHQQQALRALQEAIQKGYSSEEANNDPELGSLHSLPEYEILVKKSKKKG
jgi:serine/threonine protein kinase/tetratricopeptide (TPR) repeat protein